MVTAMDRSIGSLLDSVRDMGIENNTLIIFTSDNGPEKGAGGTAGYRGRKREVAEGGIRVPCIWQWIGTIPQGRVRDTFAVSTDLFPTFLHAAGINPPAGLHLDGVSLLPDLVPALMRKSQPFHQYNNERLTMWLNDYEGPKQLAAWIDDYKIIVDESNRHMEMFDMRIDPFEQSNLLKPIHRQISDKNTDNMTDTTGALKVTNVWHRAPADYVKNMTVSDLRRFHEIRDALLGAHDFDGTNSSESFRSDPILHLVILDRLYGYMENFEKYGGKESLPFIVMPLFYIMNSSWYTDSMCKQNLTLPYTYS
jgi:hypothetical protein